MVLIWPADIETKMPIYHAPLAERAFLRLCQDCQTDSARNKSFLDLENKLLTVVERLRAESAIVHYSHAELMHAQEVTIHADNFVESLRSILFSNWSRREVPGIVQHAYNGDFGSFLDAVIPASLDFAPVFAEGVHLSIIGAEDAPFIDEHEVAALANGTPLGDYRIDQQRRAAALWPTG